MLSYVFNFFCSVFFFLFVFVSLFVLGVEVGLLLFISFFLSLYLGFSYHDKKHLLRKDSDYGYYNVVKP